MSTAFKNANILLPENANMEKWAVVACDQYTSEPEYWEGVEGITENSKSALNLILPEVYLEAADVDQRIEKIHDNMKEYLNTHTFKEYKDALIYIERIQSDGKMRAGIVGKLDLEDYSYQKGSTTPVRATEATVVERIPPRLKVRKGADIELPHIMILIDDREKSVIEPLESLKSEMEALYNFKLMKNGGAISGYKLTKYMQDSIFAALDKLADLDEFNRKYELNEKAPLVFAMGDGNHSLATAKEFYEQLKKENPGKDMSNHPARYALVEIVNLHSPALEFEAIHRIVTDIDRTQLLAEMICSLDLTEDKSEQKIQIVQEGKIKDMYIHNPTSKLTVGSLQNFLDKYLEENCGKIDYIHGTDVVKKLSMDKNSVGFILPDMGKEELFPTVICDGALPRKTFSMGHAEDKRFYIEARKITV
ncbi:MAG: DUF1015 domain-containing protein [Ruminococcus sp.]|nr:DUF1015 domain-containing protein [Ruminococcus sp.]